MLQLDSECHSHLQYLHICFICLTYSISAAAKSLQSCPTLCDPIDGSPPGCPVPGILQARTLEWVAISFSNAWKWKVKVKSLSRVRPSATPWIAAFQAPPSMGFSRQEYWSGVPLPSLYSVSNKVYFQEATLNCGTVISQVLTDHKHYYFPTWKFYLHMNEVSKKQASGSFLNLWVFLLVLQYHLFFWHCLLGQKGPSLNHFSYRIIYEDQNQRNSGILSFPWNLILNFIIKEIHPYYRIKIISDLATHK